MNLPNTAQSRRRFLRTIGKGSGALVSASLLPQILLAKQGPALHVWKHARPSLPAGISSGGMRQHSAMIWSKADRASQMLLKWSTRRDMRHARVQALSGPAALEHSDFTAKLLLDNLPADQTIYYEVAFQSLRDPKAISESIQGQFRTAPSFDRDIRFVWSGDTCGQGYGINPDWGGMRIYETMRQRKPDFFLHSGDTIYADGPIPSEKTLPDGSIWKNLTTEETSKVAETLDEFRGNYRYNLMDHNLRAFHKEVPVIYQWDDHETSNNWYPGEILDDDRYTVKEASLLAARGRQAFLDYTPIRSQSQDAEQIYRQIPYGPLLDVFVIDMRSYRGPNTANLQPVQEVDSTMLGQAQIDWLIQGLKSSKATWKVIASDMPIGLLVHDYNQTFEGIANGDARLLGREWEIAHLLRSIKTNNIQNIVWLTADVHYTAAHYYDPNKAVFQDFLPFYEFVSGPLNSGTFGPGELDKTFGPEVLFHKAPPEGQSNLAPSAGLQFFGEVEISAETKNMMVTLRDVAGEALYKIELEA